MDMTITRNHADSPAMATYSTIPLSDIMRPSLSGGVIALPVENSIPFTQFKYVQGVPSDRPGTGYPLSKLAALDALIEGLVNLRSRITQPDVPKSVDGMTEGAVDELIKQLSERMHVAMQAGMPAIQQSLGISMGSPVSQNGVLVNALV